MKLRKRKEVSYYGDKATSEHISDDSSGDGSVQISRKRTKSRNHGKDSSCSGRSEVQIIPDSEDDDGVFESPPPKKKKIEHTTLRRSSRMTVVTRYKETPSIEILDSEDAETDKETDDFTEKNIPRGETYHRRSRSHTSKPPDAVVTNIRRSKPSIDEDIPDSEDADTDEETDDFTGKSFPGDETRHGKGRPKRTCTLKPVVTNIRGTSKDTVVRAPRSCNLKTVVEVESETDTESQEQEQEAVGTGYTVGRYGLQVDGKFPSVMKHVRRVDKILAVRDRSGTSPVYCVKEPGKSYRCASTVTEATLQKYAPTLLRNFLKRMDSLKRLDGHTGTTEDGPAFDPQYLVIDRIIASEYRGRTRKFYVKWKALSYMDATWELETSMAGEKMAIQRFIRNSSNATRSRNIMSGFRDGRTLRDYQKEGVAWLDRNFRLKVNCILADEMGLGKTIQSVAMLENMRSKHKRKGPFLVIAPVSTLGHWQREIESLTDLNCVVYTGSQEDRIIIQQYEFWNPKEKTPKFTVLLSSFEILLKEKNIFGKISWEYVIVDEAHRLKSRESKTTCALSCLDIKKGGLLLLTGTPVQNNTKEIFSLLTLLDPDEFDSEDNFMTKYGNIKDIEQVRELQENILKPRLLRRMKEDVEKSIPLKEETIIWVELTKEQRNYYRAIYENRIQDLMKGAHSSNIPNLRNMSMELRKVCNHPFLCDGIEDDFNSKFSTDRSLVQSSGKMVLLDKMLPMLKDGGHRVLIFSQFTIMLDILEDYLSAKDYAFERIDGKIRGSDRQAAIDRYSAKDSKSFVFLLSTRAGGLGITLTAADTCIIYDSDWNPQNDLQAMARCHRIGQTKDVKIYRLITKSTYEERLFECSSRKYGLDEAILGNYQDTEQEDVTKNIESLLRHGAYDMLREDGDREADAFDAENIDHILEQRTQKRTIGGRGKNTFSVATFVSVEDLNHGQTTENVDLEMDAEEFWKRMLPEACDRQLDESTKMLGGKRRRNKVDYRENGRRVSEPQSSQSHDYDDAEGEDDDEPDSESSKAWTEVELRRLENVLAVFGKLEAGKLVEMARLEDRNLAEVEEVAEAMIQLCRYLHTKNQDGTQVCEQPPLPLAAEKAFKSKSVMQRLEKKAARYVRVFHEREVIAKAVAHNALSIYLPRSRKVPGWWGEAEDLDLLKGVHIYGNRNYSKIRSDPNLCFASRNFVDNNDEPTEEEGAAPAPSDNKWPTDSVLAGRLRSIIHVVSKQTGQVENSKEHPTGECPGLKQAAILRPNKRIISGKPDEQCKRAKMSTQQAGTSGGIPVYVETSSDSEARQAKVKAIHGPEAAPPSAAEMNKENLVPIPKRHKRRNSNSSEKQATLLGYFSPK